MCFWFSYRLLVGKIPFNSRASLKLKVLYSNTSKREAGKIKDPQLIGGNKTLNIIFSIYVCVENIRIRGACVFVCKCVCVCECVRQAQCEDQNFPKRKEKE